MPKLTDRDSWFGSKSGVYGEQAFEGAGDQHPRHVIHEIGIPQAASPVDDPAPGPSPTLFGSLCRGVSGQQKFDVAAGGSMTVWTFTFENIAAGVTATPWPITFGVKITGDTAALAVASTFVNFTAPVLNGGLVSAPTVTVTVPAFTGDFTLNFQVASGSGIGEEFGEVCSLTMSVRDAASPILVLDADCAGDTSATPYDFNGGPAAFNVLMANPGNGETWTAAPLFELRNIASSHTATGAPVGVSGPIVKGATETFAVTVPVPSFPATVTYQFQMWDPVGMTLFGDICYITIVMVDGVSVDNSICLGVIGDNVKNVGDPTFNISVAFKNPGPSVWTAGYNITAVGAGVGPLGIPASTLVGAGTPITGVAGIEWTFPVTVPGAGSYPVTFQMDNGSGVFGATCGYTLLVNAAGTLDADANFAEGFGGNLPAGSFDIATACLDLGTINVGPTSSAAGGVSYTFLNTGAASPADTWTAAPAFSLALVSSTITPTTVFPRPVVVDVLVGGAVTGNVIFPIQGIAEGDHTIQMQMQTDALVPFGDILTIKLTATLEDAITCDSDSTPDQVFQGETFTADVAFRRGVADWPLTMECHPEGDADVFGIIGSVGPNPPFDVTDPIATFTFTSGTTPLFGTAQIDYVLREDSLITSTELARCEAPIEVLSTVLTSDIDATCVSNTAPATAAYGATEVFDVVMNNAGESVEWEDTYQLILIGGSNGAADPVNVTGGPIAIGANETFSVSAVMPSSGGTAILRFQMWAPGVGLFGEVCEIPAITMTGTVVGQCAGFVDWVTFDSEQEPGAESVAAAYQLEMNNCSAVPWFNNAVTPGQAFTAGYRLKNVSPIHPDTGVRPEINNANQEVLIDPAGVITVAPAANHTFDIPMVWPNTPGYVYDLQFQMQDLTGNLFESPSTAQQVVIVDPNAIQKLQVTAGSEGAGGDTYEYQCVVVGEFGNVVHVFDPVRITNVKPASPDDPILVTAPNYEALSGKNTLTYSFYRTSNSALPLAVIDSLNAQVPQTEVTALDTGVVPAVAPTPIPTEESAKPQSFAEFTAQFATTKSYYGGLDPVALPAPSQLPNVQTDIPLDGTEGEVLASGDIEFSFLSTTYPMLKDVLPESDIPRSFVLRLTGLSTFVTVYYTDSYGNEAGVRIAVIDGQKQEIRRAMKRIRKIIVEAPDPAATISSGWGSRIGLKYPYRSDQGGIPTPGISYDYVCKVVARTFTGAIVRDVTAVRMLSEQPASEDRNGLVRFLNVPDGLTKYTVEYYADSLAELQSKKYADAVEDGAIVVLKEF